MLGAKPPSSPTFVASWPYFFLITDWKMKRNMVTGVTYTTNWKI
jgi:hypothetical protein